MLGQNKDIDTFISLLKEAKKPVVLAGAGINQSKSNQLLTQFVNKHQNPNSYYLLGLGAVPSADTLFLGMGDSYYASNMALTECDLLINLGSYSLFDDRISKQTFDAFAPNAKIVHVDIDPLNE
ncbi:hypothetical protein ACVXZZ_02375 [Staphylococcus aureus]